VHAKPLAKEDQFVVKRFHRDLIKTLSFQLCWKIFHCVRKESCPPELIELLILT